MIDIISKSIEKAKKDPRRIVFPEGTEPRILRAVEIIKKEGIAHPILIGNEEEIRNKAAETNVNLEGIQIINPEHSDKLDIYADRLVEIRKGKVESVEKAKEILKDSIYYGTMMVRLSDADGLIGGATTSTADTVRPALQIIKTKGMFHKVSGVFFMVLKEKLLLFADAAVNIDPDAKDLAEIAIDSAETAKEFDIEPRIAMLSFSTKGSAKHPIVDKVVEATKIVQYKRPDLLIDGDMQVDAALVPEVCDKKCPGCKLHGDANVLIFPDLESGNIAYKLVERLAKAEAIGPILQGLAKPVNDLSRGCDVEDVVHVTAITVVQAQNS